LSAVRGLRLDAAFSSRVSAFSKGRLKPQRRAEKFFFKGIQKP
jgi:hypothetical protein